MQAIILAAGMGKRLKDLTNNITKCMVKVNGVTMIERMLSQLDKLNLSSIVIVVGYKADKLIEYISNLYVCTPIIYVNNSIYYKTNNIYSLYLAKNYLLKEDTLLLESDLIFEDSVLKKILNNPYPSLALVAKYESWMDGTVVTLDEENNIRDFLDKKHFKFAHIHSYYKTVNIYKFSKEFSNTYYVPFLEAYSKALGDNEYYEQVLKVIALLDKPNIKATLLENEAWYEIDDVQDLDIAESIFTASPENKLTNFQSRCGGYWRYPNLIDFCYLTNPFYPPSKLLDEIKANFERLICNYPSNIDINSLLVAKYFGLNKEQICVGNGATELINSLMNKVTGKIGMIFPNGEEYQNRIKAEDIVAYYSDNNNYTYSADNLIEYFNDKKISNLVLINPDNTCGNYIQKENVLRISKWAEKNGITFIVDESFVDFADTKEPATLLDENILNNNPKLIVIKSISKSFGVPGLRLGVLATSNLNLIKFLKEDVSTWNVNSFAEFYIQIFEKYKSDYKDAIEKFKIVRKDYIEKLIDIEKLRLMPAHANFVLCELLGDNSATELSEILLSDYNILIKDLSNNYKNFNGQFIRIAVKQRDENNKLIKALRNILN